MGREFSTHKGEEEFIQDFGGKARTNETPLGRPRRRWEENIKVDLRDIGWSNMDCIEVAQDRDQWSAVVFTAMNIRVP
jgi:hypothetical protein